MLHLADIAARLAHNGDGQSAFCCLAFFTSIIHSHGRRLSPTEVRPKFRQVEDPADLPTSASLLHMGCGRRGFR